MTTTSQMSGRAPGIDFTCADSRIGIPDDEADAAAAYLGTRGSSAPDVQVRCRNWRLVAVPLRLTLGGYADENAKLTDCYYEKKDWRLCTKEVRHRSAS
jgi:hypothetical protein